jgi:hypothetical protein
MQFTTKKQPEAKFVLRQSEDKKLLNRGGRAFIVHFIIWGNVRERLFTVSHSIKCIEK